MDSYVDVMLAGLAILVLILFVLLIIALVKISRVNKRYRKIIGNASVENVDDLLISLQNKVDELTAASKQQADAITGIRGIMRTMKSNVSIKRYNAFSQQGSDLSFSMAILDDEQDGVILTGIHSREESYLYAKPVDKGQSSYTLSPEEKEVIAQSAARKQAALSAGS
jgi:hypothetical protein